MEQLTNAAVGAASGCHRLAIELSVGKRWHPDLQLMRQQLLDQLALSDESAVRSLSVQRMMGIQKLAEDE